MNEEYEKNIFKKVYIKFLIDKIQIITNLIKVLNVKP